MKTCLINIFLLMQLAVVRSQSMKLHIIEEQGQFRAAVMVGDSMLLSAPEEGSFSIATAWENGWSAQWHHASATQMEQVGEWVVLSGKLALPEGEWLLKDHYREENGLIKCIRRMEWKGTQPLGKITLAVRWQVPSTDVNPFLPGIMYHGNPSGEKNGRSQVAWYHSQPGDEAIFEEHRYPMPFASVEWQQSGAIYGAALHTIPSPVYRGNKKDQWWSMGLTTHADHSELTLLSGPVAYNGERNRAKALQQGPLEYGDTYIEVMPNTVIEKTFYLEAYPLKQKGSSFQRPVHTSIRLYKPFYTEDLPSYADIIRLKYQFARSRWMEGTGYAGYNMYPSYVKPQVVLGWAGQSEAPGFALQVLADELKDTLVWDRVQRSLDHICTSSIDEDGFSVIYDINNGSWSGKDPVSQGQAMYNLALAIKEGRKNKKVNTNRWEVFVKKAADVFSSRILSSRWEPVNTAEAFFIAPLLLCNELFKKPSYKSAALKAADYYATRHLSMDEPYWGGTLDATCEDKEGAWGAFQGFLSAYETTKEAKYLEYARHACDVVLSYTAVWDIPLPAGRLADHAFKSRGWTMVSAQNQHLDVFGVLIAPTVYKMGLYLQDEQLKKIAKTMFLSCGQLIDPTGAHGEQIQHTNFAQHGKMDDVYALRGGYSESWTVFWITAHFLHAAAQFRKMGVRF